MPDRWNLQKVNDKGLCWYRELQQSNFAPKGTKRGSLGVNTDHWLAGDGTHSLFQGRCRLNNCKLTPAHVDLPRLWLRLALALSNAKGPLRSSHRSLEKVTSARYS